MHPYTMSRLAIDHADELSVAAGRSRLHVTPAGPRNSVRYRTGRMLVGIGLRLAGAPDDA
jgi:hypothetical protein